MRKITNNAVNAFMNAKEFNSGNTEVTVLPNVTVLKLHGNEIAYRYNDPQRTLSITNCGWESNTMKERLNALEGVSISQKNFVWYLNGKEWDGNLIDIKPKGVLESLEYLRQELRAERISTEELIQLQSLAEYIDSDDVELLEAAGVPENN